MLMVVGLRNRNAGHAEKRNRNWGELHCEEVNSCDMDRRKVSWIGTSKPLNISTELDGITSEIGFKDDEKILAFRPQMRRSDNS